MGQLFVEWTDELSVGIQEIDEQHKILVNLINRLFDETVLNEADPSVIDQIFLKKWLENHIQQEDKLYASFLIEHGVKSTWAKKFWLGKIWKSHK